MDDTNWATTSESVQAQSDIRTSESETTEQRHQMQDQLRTMPRWPLGRPPRGHIWATTSVQLQFPVLAHRFYRIITFAHHQHSMQRRRQISTASGTGSGAGAVAAAAAAAEQQIPQQQQQQLPPKLPGVCEAPVATTVATTRLTDTQSTTLPQPLLQQRPGGPQGGHRGGSSSRQQDQLGNDIRFRIRLSWLNTRSAGQRHQIQQSRGPSGGLIGTTTTNSSVAVLLPNSYDNNDEKRTFCQQSSQQENGQQRLEQQDLTTEEWIRNTEKSNILIRSGKINAKQQRQQ